ncbi:MAG: GAF domain-containing protein [Elainellaceae cyanobacterium]
MNIWNKVPSFSNSYYMPHGHCYLWQTPLVTLHVTSDLLIAIAYFSIPIMLVYFVRKRQDTTFTTVFLLFGAFIASCGLGHLFDIWTLWFPNYWVAGVERAFTAFISCLTAIKFVEWMPQFLALRSPQELEHLNHQLQQEIAARKKAQQILQRLIEGTASATGEAFFSALVQNLAEALQVRQAFVTHRVNSETIRSLSVWADGALAENFEMRLQKSLCGQVIQEGTAKHYPDSVQDRFPEVELLKAWQAETYLGVPLVDENGQSIGSLCITHDRPLEDASEAEAIMTIFAARAAAELQRQQAETELRNAYIELEQRVAARTTELTQANTQLTKVARREQATSQVLQHMRQSLNLETIFRTTTQELRQVMECDRVIVYRFNPDWSGRVIAESVGHQWRPLHQDEHEETDEAQPWQANLLREDRCTVRLAPSKSDAKSDELRDTYMQDTQGGMYRQGIDYLAVDDIFEREFDDCYLNLLASLQARAYMTVPIQSGQQLWGLLACYQNSGPRHWESGEGSMLSRIGVQLGVAIQQAELFQRTQQQAQELCQARDAADKANRAKSKFLANMSHELRTPLNAILGFTELMVDEPTLSKQHQSYVDIINTSGEHLLSLINNILEMSKIEAGQTELQLGGFNLQGLLQELLDLFSLKAQNQGISLELQLDAEVPQCICGDAQKLRQVLLNLIGNSIKFTKTGGVTVIVSLSDSADSDIAESQLFIDQEQAERSIHVTFSVKDTGVGISETELSLLFEAFQQTQSGRDLGQGTGLGLPISQQYVQLMGGNLVARSDVGQGSEFSFTIPTQTVAMKQVASSGGLLSQKVIGIASGQSVPRILVVEDNPINRFLLKQLLEPLGFDVREAVNGEMAISAWKTWSPDLIWMDMRMPKVDDYAATRRIRAEEALSNLPPTVIIALTATAFEENRKEMLEAGCDDVLSKPFQVQKMMHLLQHYLNLEFIYEASPEVLGYESEPPVLTPDVLNEMPDEWSDQLRRYALECDDQAVLKLIEKIPLSQDSLKRRLQYLAHEFLFDEILRLVG